MNIAKFLLVVSIGIGWKSVFRGLMATIPIWIAPSHTAAITLAPLADFDGDGKSDVAVARRDSWRIMKWGIRCSRAGLLDTWSDWFLPDFGNESDKFYAGDFDGNGRTDMALCRRTSGSQYAWAVRYSTTGMLNRDVGFVVDDYGNDWDFFFVGDFNGDGRDDIAVCRPESSTQYKWAVSYSSATRILDGWTDWVVTDFGDDGDRFYVGDFDGNGRADLLCGHLDPANPYRISWTVRFSVAGFLDVNAGQRLYDFGNAYDEFYVGDFDGNGKSDLAIARQTSSTDMVWGVQYSMAHSLDTWGGWASRTEVGNQYFVVDYDGDGTHEIAVSHYVDGFTTRWGVYASTARFLDTWSDWVLADFGDQEDRFFPGDDLGNTISDIAVRELGVSSNYSRDYVDYITHGNYSTGGSTAWCSEFVSWCYHRAGNSFFGGTLDAGAPWLLDGTLVVRTWFQDNAFWFDRADASRVLLKPGNYVRTGSGATGHSRMVQRIIGDELYTVEGNASSRVRKKILDDYLLDTDIDGFGRLYNIDTEDWKIQASATTRTLNAIAMTSSTSGYAVGDYGTVLATINGGKSWYPVTVAAAGTNNLRDIASDGSRLYIAGDRGLILKQQLDGSWAAQTSGTANSLYAIAFTAVDKGVAVGQSGKVLYTDDGGSTWRSGTSGTTNTLWDVAWINSTDLIAVGSNGTIRKSTTEGSTWTSKTSGTTRSLQGVDFYSSTGWIVGDLGTILKSTTSGDSWASQTSPTTRALHDVAAESLGQAHAVGDSGTIINTDDGDTWATQTSGESDSFNGVYAVLTDEIWTIGRRGVVVHAEYGGGPLLD